MVDAKKTVSLVLGSGGARGHAHIGVIKAVEERGYEITNISGTSMGAAIGGIHAAGKLETYKDWAYQLEKSDVFKLLDLSFSWQSLFKGERIIEVLKDLIGDQQIEDLDKRFTAVATSLDEQREVWLNNGSLFTAIRASTAVPGVFAPVELDGRRLVDGGLVNPIPIAPTLNDSTDMTIAVSLAGVEKETKTPEKEVATKPESSSYRERILEFLGTAGSDEEQTEDDPDAAELLVKSIDVMQGAIARLKLAAYAPDKTIEIPRNACTFFEFHRAEELAELGYEEAKSVLNGSGH
ncbi:MAG: patatin-like phospholipase family protein [Pseudomonadota bacterium]